MTKSTTSWIGTTASFTLFLTGNLRRLDPRPRPAPLPPPLRHLLPRLRPPHCLPSHPIPATPARPRHLLRHRLRPALHRLHRHPAPNVFTTKRSAVTGIDATGSSLAAIICPASFHYMIDKTGFGWTVRVIAFTSLAPCLVSLSAAKLRPPPPRAKLVELSGFREPEYGLFAQVSFLGGVCQLADTDGRGYHKRSKNYRWTSRHE